MSWLDELVHMHSDMESPTSFWLWSGLVTISAVVKDNVWLNRGGKYNLYPNIYCILHADSGLKKGPPINLSKRLVKKVNNTRLIIGRSSIQGILKELGTTQTTPGGKVNTKSVGYINASELSSSLVTDPAALTILTDLYDRNYWEGEYSSLLKMETFQLKDPTVTLFGGINAAHADEFFEMKDLRGGFFARTFIVYEKVEANINSLVRRGITVDEDKLVKYLKELSKLEGPFQELSDLENEFTEVGAFYDDWYNHFRKTIKEAEIRDETGTLNRFGDSVLKIAMLISLAKEPKLEIDLESMKQAIAIGEKLIAGIRQATQGKIGSKDISNANRKSLLIQELMARDTHSITQIQLLKKYWMQGNLNEWIDACQALDAGGMITTQAIGNQIIYQMPETEYQKMKQFLEGKNK